MEQFGIGSFADDEVLVGEGHGIDGSLIWYFGGYGFLEGEGYIHEFFAVDVFLLGFEVEESKMGYSFELVVGAIHGKY